MGLAGAILALVLAAGSVSAHHSYGAYDITPAEFDGVIEGLAWVNPHVLLTLKTEAATYTVEWSAMSAMARRGIARDTLREGDRVVVTGRPRHDVRESGLVLLQAIRRPADGWRWPPR